MCFAVRIAPVVSVCVWGSGAVTAYKANQNFAQLRSSSTRLVGAAVANAAHASATRPPSLENMMSAKAECGVEAKSKAKLEIASPRWYSAVYRLCLWTFIREQESDRMKAPVRSIRVSMMGGTVCEENRMVGLMVRWGKPCFAASRGQLANSMEGGWRVDIRTRDAGDCLRHAESVTAVTAGRGISRLLRVSFSESSCDVC